MRLPCPLLGAALLVLASGCVLRSSTVDTSSLRLLGAQLAPSETKVKTPLYLVVGTVPHEMTATGEATFTVRDLRGFVAKDVAAALRRHFVVVEVVDSPPSDAPPARIEARILLSRLVTEDWRRKNVDPVGTIHLGIDWSFEMRDPRVPDSATTTKERTFGERGQASEEVTASALDALTKQVVIDAQQWAYRR
jgi:hypothetical protein